MLALKSNAFWLVVISAVALVAFSRGSTGRYDKGWLATSDGVFAEGAPLHCSGIEFMTAAQAIEWLGEHGYPQLRILETRPSFVPDVGGAAGFR